VTGFGERESRAGRRERWFGGEAAEREDRRSARACSGRAGRRGAAAEGSREARWRMDSTVGGAGGCDDGGPSTAAADIASERAAGGEFGESGGRRVGFSLTFPFFFEGFRFLLRDERGESREAS
jgi:hypothetical protein